MLLVKKNELLLHDFLLVNNDSNNKNNQPDQT